MLVVMKGHMYSFSTGINISTPIRSSNISHPQTAGLRRDKKREECVGGASVGFPAGRRFLLSDGGEGGRAGQAEAL